MDELTVGLGPFHAANWEHFKHEYMLDFIQESRRAFSELTAECSYKSVGTGLLLLFEE